MAGKSVYIEFIAYKIQLGFRLSIVKLVFSPYKNNHPMKINREEVKIDYYLFNRNI
jgi:hypothetical protein